MSEPLISMKTRLQRRKAEFERDRQLRKKKLSEARATSLDALAELYESSPGAIAEKEKFVDQYVRTLRHYIQQSGGELRITVTFPKGEGGGEEIIDTFLR